jgi:ribosomal protein L17
MICHKVNLLKEKVPEVISELIQSYYLNSRILQRELTEKKEYIDSKRIVKMMRKDLQESLFNRYGSYVSIMRAYKRHAQGEKTMPIGKFVVLRSLMV